jgi:glucosamine kinase
VAGSAGVAESEAGGAAGLGVGVAERVAGALAGVGPVLGVDAGGSGTRAALVVDGVVTRRLTAGPFNFLLYEGGVDQMAALAREAQPAAMGIGVPGIAREPGGTQAFGRAIAEASGVPTLAAPDATVAWLGAFLGDPGIIVSAGTGSVAVGGSSPDRLVRVGGHGHLIGDEGSAYWIGRRALRAALAAAEQAGPPTGLLDAILAATAGTLDQFVLRVQRAPADRTILTGLTPLVARLAEGPEADPVAQKIIADAAAALAGLAGALRARFGDLPVAGSGGVLSIPSLWAAFQAATGAGRPLAPPEIGAALLLADRSTQ